MMYVLHLLLVGLVSVREERVHLVRLTEYPMLEKAVHEVGDSRVPDLPEAMKSRLGPALDKPSSMIGPVIQLRGKTAHPGIGPVAVHVVVVPSAQPVSCHVSFFSPLSRRFRILRRVLR